jgi:hypothetical protein
MRGLFVVNFVTVLFIKFIQIQLWILPKRNNQTSNTISRRSNAQFTTCCVFMQISQKKKEKRKKKKLWKKLHLLGLNLTHEECIVVL